MYAEGSAVLIVISNGSRTAFRDSTRHRRLQLLDEPFFACSAVLLTFGAAAASDGLMAAHLSAIGALSTTQHSHVGAPAHSSPSDYRESSFHTRLQIHEELRTQQCWYTRLTTRTRASRNAHANAKWTVETVRCAVSRQLLDRQSQLLIYRPSMR